MATKNRRHMSLKYVEDKMSDFWEDINEIKKTMGSIIFGQSLSISDNIDKNEIKAELERTRNER